MFAYQLAVVVDDLAMRITHVVRGADLARSAPRQIWLARALAATPPRYAHVPLVVTADGARLEKRTPGVTVRSLRESGFSPPTLLGAMAHGLGLTSTDAPSSALDLARASTGPSFPLVPGAAPPAGWPIPWTGGRTVA